MWSITLEFRPRASALIRWIVLRSTFSVCCATDSRGARKSRGATSSVFFIWLLVI